MPYLARDPSAETQQVWDFAGDGFVHRLIHNKADGKLVEISDPGQTSEERPQVPASLSDIQVCFCGISPDLLAGESVVFLSLARVPTISHCGAGKRYTRTTVRLECGLSLVEQETRLFSLCAPPR